MTALDRISDLYLDRARLIAIKLEHSEIYGWDPQQNLPRIAGARFFFDTGLDVYVPDPDIATKLHTYFASETVAAPSGATQSTSSAGT